MGVSRVKNEDLPYCRGRGLGRARHEFAALVNPASQQTPHALDLALAAFDHRVKAAKRLSGFAHTDTGGGNPCSAAEAAQRGGSGATPRLGIRQEAMIIRARVHVSSGPLVFLQFRQFDADDVFPDKPAMRIVAVVILNLQAQDVPGPSH